MISFMRNLLYSALKGNELMTGVVRTAKGGILSGLNNPNIYTMLDSPFSDKFGFTEEESNKLLCDFDCLNKKEELKLLVEGKSLEKK